MKVLMITGGFPSPSQTFVLYDFLLSYQKGVDIYLLSDSKEFDFLSFFQDNFNIPWDRVFYLSWRSIPLLSGLIRLRPEVANFLVKDAKMYGFELSFRRACFFSYLVKKFSDVDVIHAHFVQWGYEVGLPLSKLLKKPLIVTAHDGHLLDYEKSILMELGEKSYAIICPSNFQKQRWLSKTSKGNLIVLPNAVDINKFSDRIKMPLSSPSVKILVVSRLIKHKRVSDVLLALSSLVKDGFNCTLTIIGDGPDHNFLKSLANDLGIDDKVKFMGFVSHELVVREMLNSDIFVHPSENESFGIVVIEAMAAGLPVVVADSGGVRDFVKNGITGFLYPPGDISALTSFLKRMISSPSEIKDLIINGKEFVFNNYSFDIHISKLLNIWKSAKNENSLSYRN